MVASDSAFSFLSGSVIDDMPHCESLPISDNRAPQKRLPSSRSPLRADAQPTASSTLKPITPPCHTRASSTIALVQPTPVEE